MSLALIPLRLSVSYMYCESKKRTLSAFFIFIIIILSIIEYLWFSRIIPSTFSCYRHENVPTTFSSFHMHPIVPFLIFVFISDSFDFDCILLALGGSVSNLISRAKLSKPLFQFFITRHPWW